MLDRTLPDPVPSVNESNALAVACCLINRYLRFMLLKAVAKECNNAPIEQEFRDLWGRIRNGCQHHPKLQTKTVEDFEREFLEDVDFLEGKTTIEDYAEGHPGWWGLHIGPDARLPWSNNLQT
jgi:hypothetical protein